MNIGTSSMMRSKEKSQILPLTSGVVLVLPDGYFRALSEAGNMSAMLLLNSSQNEKEIVGV